jgi:excisionase family DNA binding protein
MALSIKEAAQVLGKTRRQVAYMIDQGELPAKKSGGRWVIERPDLNVDEPRRQRVSRKQAQFKAVIEEAVIPGNQRYTLRDLKAVQLAIPIYRQLAERGAGCEKAASHMRECLDQLAVGCHRYDRQEKTLAYPAARDAASLACQRRHAWRLHLDIRAYFLSIQHERLLALFAERVKDRDTIELLHVVITASEQVYRTPLAASTLGERCPAPGYGLPLGSWFSQWCGNFYLDGLDHVIKRVLKIPGYGRFMDDLVLFADDNIPLLDARESIAAWLAEHRGLRLNPKHLSIEPTRTPAVLLGYRVSRAGISPSRKLRRRFRGKLREAAANGEDALCRTIRSYQGLLLFP